MASRKTKKDIFENLLVSRPTQGLLFGEPEVPLGTGFYPRIHLNREGFEKTLSEALEEGALGYDLEFTGLRPSIVGIASTRSAASLPSSPELIEMVYESGLPLVGHAVISADKPVTEGPYGLGAPTDLKRWEDTLLLFYLLHQHYAKTEDRSDSGEDSGESGSIGVFDLFTVCAHYILIPRWKDCRGKFCTGPCPRCAPFLYNAVDSWAPLMAWYRMKEEYEQKIGSWNLYWHKAHLAAICERMETRGIKLNLETANSISLDIETKRLAISESLEFNPNSPAQILQHFKSRGLYIDSASKDTILHELKSSAETYGYDIDSIDESAPELLQELKKVYDFKQAGKGIKSWVDDKYLDVSKKVHPRFIVASTSTGRLSCASPNYQNVPKRGAMSVVRKVIIPSREDYILLGEDLSQMELRVVLHEAGYKEALEGDTYNMVTEAAGELFAGPAKDTNRKPRDIAKIVVLGTNYMLGYHAYNEQDLISGRTKVGDFFTTNRKLIDSGALYVFEDWDYSGLRMCMNGKKLAYLLFGEDSISNRRRAIEIQLGYLAKFPKVLDWQKNLGSEIESTHRITRRSGAFLKLPMSDPNDALKKATAFVGQGSGADFVQGAMRVFDAKYGIVPILQVHDECIFEIPTDWDYETCLNFLKPMNEENDGYPGFLCPGEPKRGPSWGEMVDLERSF